MFGRNDKLLAFSKLAFVLRSDIEDVDARFLPARQAFDKACVSASENNVWFTQDNVSNAIKSICCMLQQSGMEDFLNRYDNIDIVPKTVGVIMAGNIPLVGFHDFFCVLMSGHRFIGKLSHNDPYLLPALADMLCTIEPRFSDFICFTDNILSDFDAVIATGSNNTSRYFDFYFSKYPNIIRKNRNSVAVLRGDESFDALTRLADDVFLYFGLGCRSVSFLLVPANYDFTDMFKAFSKYEHLATHARYFNNYEYNKAVCLVNNVKHYDNGFLILKESDVMASPVSMLYYKEYDNLSDVMSFLQINEDKIQCVVTEKAFMEKSFDFGKAQIPSLMDYADGIDTMNFLLNI